METYSTLRLLAVVAVIGVPAALVCWMLLSASKKKRPCACGGQVTPLAGHCPCGGQLAEPPLRPSDWEARRTTANN